MWIAYSNQKWYGGDLAYTTPPFAWFAQTYFIWLIHISFYVVLYATSFFLQRPEEDLRWAVGAILSENGSEVDEKVKAAYAKEKYKFMTLPAVEASVNCSFPYVNQMSILIAVHRVYPAMSKYIKVRSLIWWLVRCWLSSLLLWYHEPTVRELSF